MENIDINQAISLMAAEILAATPQVNDIVILGIPKRGVPLASRLAASLHAKAPGFNPGEAIGQLDITMYRDDLNRQPTRAVGKTETPKIDGKTVILVDDVLASGRTVRAALDALYDLGRPAVVRLAVLVDREVRELPIAADFVAIALPTPDNQRVSVRLVETDGSDDIIISPAAQATSG
ncbi:MAG: bifunctional pyr operon transcriptional regulator/uracil phosphoribosyltransferase PyrR [Cellulomonadaceae bacterium]|jgi:pyrimidine operon attenuation protein/uracil phosphoribosyltransferase|nr:bifunctional pyr operon transcriptional regulator/uracil phosphoribosyltransferase PyrR [Cellulomonadaceae bacterium]